MIPLQWVTFFSNKCFRKMKFLIIEGLTNYFKLFQSTKHFDGHQALDTCQPKARMIINEKQFSTEGHGRGRNGNYSNVNQVQGRGSKYSMEHHQLPSYDIYWQSTFLDIMQNLCFPQLVNRREENYL